MYMEGIILSCISQLNANRSIFGIYHIITGKKSIQSVHDAHLFHLEKFYGVHQSISRHQFIEIIAKLKKKALIETGPLEDSYQISKLGKEQLGRIQNSALFRHINGLANSGKDSTFLKRFYLLVQTYSNIQANNYSFIPIIDEQDVMQWVKNFYRKHSHHTITTKLYDELYELLSTIGDEAAEFFVDRLSGYKHFGMSMEQLASKYQITRDDAVIYLTSITHQLISLINNNQGQYPILNLIIEDLEHNKFITNTAKQTYQLLNNHFSLEEIAQKRNLKLNTICDHIVEIALYDKDFQIDLFVSIEEQQEIIAVMKRKQTFKLKVIKDNCSDSISYFKIRLVLARQKELLPGEEVNV